MQGSTRGVPIDTDNTLSLDSDIVVASQKAVKAYVTAQMSLTQPVLGYTPVNVAGDTMTGYLTLNGDPVNLLHAASKQYVDNVVSGINFHIPVHAATTGNLSATYSNGTGGIGATLTATANGALVVDGHTLLANERVLVWQQTSGLQNGIYTVTQTGNGSTPFILTRATDDDQSPPEMMYGDFCFVQQGTLYGGYGFINNTSGTITIGVTAITYVQFNAAQVVAAGYGLLESTPNVLSVDTTVIAPINSPAFTGTVTGITKSMVGLGSVVNADTTTTANITDSTNKRFVTDAQLVVIGNTSGTNTGDETGSTIKTKLGAATALVSGYLSNGDWSTFNNKQDALSGTGLVKSTAGVISYDTSTYLTSAVTSVGLSMPTGFSVGSSPVTSSGTIAVTFTSGYSLPTTTSQTNWDTAYTNRITSLTVTGNSGAATLSSNTLNIPTYTLAGLGGQASSTNLTSLSGLTYASTSFVKMTASGTFALDTNTYGTGTVTSVAALTLGTTGTDLSSTIATGTTTPVITLNVPTASATNRGALSSTDWSTFNSKESALTFSSPLSRSVNTISIPAATSSVNGYLTSTDWSTFNNKVSTTRSISTTAPLAGGGDLSADRTLSITQSTTSTDGYLSSTDWNTFNNKIRTQYNIATSTQSITAATETYLTNSNISTANIKAGTVVTWTISISKTAAGVATPIWTVRFGTAASTADSTLLTYTGSTQTAAADTALVVIRCVFRSVGSGTSAVLFGHYSLNHHLTTTGFSSIANNHIIATSAGFNSTTANAFLGVTVNSGAAAVWTINMVNVAIENIN